MGTKLSPDSLASRLRRLVARDDWTAKRVARELDCSYFSVLNWTNRKHEVSRAYRRSLDTLLTKEGVR